MRDYSKVLPKFWIGETGKKIKAAGQETQLTALYLITSPHSNMVGIYYLPITFIAHETGIHHDSVKKALQSLIEIGFCSYDEEKEYVWVHEMAVHQMGAQLKQNDNRVKSINKTCQKLPTLRFLKQFYEKYSVSLCLEAHKNIKFEEAPSKPLLSQEQEQEQEQEKEQKKEKAFMSGKPDPVSLTSHDLQSQALEILDFLNAKTGRRYRAVDTNLKLIKARLMSGVTVMDCRQVVAKKTREWRKDEKMSTYLRPATLFNASKFEQYFGELVIPASEENTAHA